MRHVKHLIVAVLAIVFIAATFANAANPIMVSVNAMKQGQFKGESTRQSTQDKIEASGFSFEITSPRDAASGLASGKRVYKPLTITKEIGAASPQFLQALTTNEVLKTVTLDFYKTNANGEEYIYYSIKLTNATVAGIRQHTPDGAGAGMGGDKHTSGVSMPQLEEISFTFQKIEVESKDGKTMAADDWSAR
jgi:type VI secretion system secreted protein Hcp